MKTVISFLLFTALTVRAQTSPERQLPTMVQNYLAKQEVPGFSTKLTPEQADWIQNAFVEALTSALGKPVGYKVGLVSKEAQERFGTDQPVRGRLLSRMLLPNGCNPR